jgi:hypothetical protein
MDPKAKKKLIAASVVLGVAVVWIIVYLSSMGGEPAAPVLSPEEAQVLETQHAEEMEKIKKTSNEGYRGGRPPGPPGSS